MFYFVNSDLLRIQEQIEKIRRYRAFLRLVYKRGKL